MKERRPIDVWRDLISNSYSNGNNLEKAIKASRESTSLLERMTSLRTLDVHAGCVNTLQWSDSGQHILSGSDDHRLVVTAPYTGKIRTDFMTAHKSNIFSAKFLPGCSDLKIVSCAGDGSILFTDLECLAETQHCLFTCHSSTTYEIMTSPGDPHSFLSCGEDGTVRWFDLRTKEKCSKGECSEDVLIRIDNAITAMSVNPMMPFYLAVGSSDSLVRVFDRRMMNTSHHQLCLNGLVTRFTPHPFEGKPKRITSVDYRPDGAEILVSYSSDYIYIFDPMDDSKTSKRLCVGQPNSKLEEFTHKMKTQGKSPPPVKRLRLRGDWSDTGPNARPENARTPSPSTSDASATSAPAAEERGNQEPQSNLMQRMTDALSRMLNDPSTRIAMRNLSDRDAAAARIQRLHRHRRQRREEAAAAAAVAEIAAEPQTEEPDEQHDPMLRRNIDNLRDSISNLREEFVQRHSSEPVVRLRQSAQGLESDTVSMEAGNQSADEPAPTEESAGIRVLDDVSSSDDNNQVRPRPTTEDRSISPVIIRNLPGPSQVVGDQGNSGINPVTGQRQRRRGVSGPPTGLYDVSESDKEELNFGSAESLVKALSEYTIDLEEGQEPEECKSRRFIRQPQFKNRFKGHRNARTMMKEASWWGNDFILSGSDCGHLFGWDRRTEKLVMLLEADRHVVNCVQPHPFDPLIATSGIDYNIKLWSPIGEESNFDQAVANEAMQRNEVMLEETRDTITVPATLMIRMLASLNQIRRAGRLMPQADENQATLLHSEEDTQEPNDE